LYIAPEISSRSNICARDIVPLRFGATLDELEFRRIQSRLALEFFKWDCQVGDVSTLFRQPLLLRPESWQELKTLAEALAAELMLAEEELLRRTGLHATLGMPAQLRSVLKQAAVHGMTPAAARSLRFDFHYSTEGWRISEVNSDVPGGYTEASAFTELVADCIPGSQTGGNPASRWADAMMAFVKQSGHIALLSAVGFVEDQQVTAFLASKLQQRGVETVLLHHPAQLNWKSGRANTVSKGKEVPLHAIVRFYQGEWLARSQNGSGWRWLFAQGKTPVTNPASALLTESKRFPLTWDYLRCPMTTWRKLLPESCDPRDTKWEAESDWVLKLAYSNTGDEVHIRELMNQEAWNAERRMINREPARWVAQQRFRTLAINSDAGPVYPCIGVYVIDGCAAGAYARVATKPVIDYSAMDAALLIPERSQSYIK
jgi:glutathionylspermidine synthase